MASHKVVHYLEEPFRQIRLDFPLYFSAPDDPSNSFFDTEFVDDCDFISSDPNALASLEILLPFFSTFASITQPRQDAQYPNGLMPPFPS